MTAVPRRSWKVTPATLARAQALRHDHVKAACEVQGLPSVRGKDRRAERGGVKSRAFLSGRPTGMTTRTPVLD